MHKYSCRFTKGSIFALKTMLPILAIISFFATIVQPQEFITIEL